MRTVNPHFDEIDWLDYAEGQAGPEEAKEMARHLSECSSCRLRSESLRRLSAALGPMGELISLEIDAERLEDRALVSRISDLAAETNLRERIARHAITEFGSELPSPATMPGLSAEHVFASIAEAREVFGSSLERSRGLIAWSRAAFQALSTKENSGESLSSLEAIVRSSEAYLKFRDGLPAAALEDLEKASELSASAPLPRDLEAAFCSYVRSCCLRDLSRFEEAIDEIGKAEEVYAAFGETARHARSRLVHAILLSDSGASAEALPIYAELLEDPSTASDPPLYARLHLSLAYELVLTGQLSRAKSVYARAAALLKQSGLEDLLFRIRIGLADIAHAEGRIEDALDLNVQLRSVLRERSLLWEEVQRELWIARQLFELGRLEEAKSTCVALAARARDISLRDEALRALSYLAATERALNLEDVVRAQEEIESISRRAANRWSAA